MEATFGTSKRVYRAYDIRAKLDDTADTWIGACFFAKNVMKFLRGLLCLIFAKLDLKAFKRRFSYSIDYLMGVLSPTRGCLVEIIWRTLIISALLFPSNSNGRLAFNVS